MKKTLTLTLTKGLPASGKTTWAKEQVEKGQGSTINVCKDDLRAMLHFDKHSKGREEMVLSMRNAIIENALANGKNVICSDTNLNPIHIEYFTEKYADHPYVNLVIKDFTDVSYFECIERDIKRGSKVGKGVIMNMYNRYLKPLPIPANKLLLKCAIFDLDGTLCVMGDRSPYEWHRVDVDTLNESVAKVLNLFYNSGTLIFLMSGRDSICRELTMKWLDDNKIKYHNLFMRAENDKRKDDIIKRELFYANIADKYYVEAVVDDRLSVARMWHSLGLPLFRVGCPDADF